MKSIRRASSIGQRTATGILIAGSFLTVLCEDAHADLTALFGQFGDKKIEESAEATQTVYDQLKRAGCDDQQAASTASCGGGTYLVWRNVREVVQNANALTPNNTGPTQYSLGRVSIALLGRALQWCNGEEFASLNSLSAGFVGAQANSLAARVTALRLGATGLRAANYNSSDDQLLASNAVKAHGGGASADSDEAGSSWGGFFGGNFIRGEKQTTSQEDEFSFDGPTLNAGLDKRFAEHWIAGTIISYQKQNVDFATVATVEAYSNLRGLSALPYLLYQSDRWYFNASLGYQDMRFNTHRRVNYASGPSATLPVTHDTFDVSESHASSWSSYDSLGFSIRPTAGWLIEPSISADYQRIKTDQFAEQDLNNQGFNFVIAEQAIESLEGVPELRTQYTFTPGFGVWVPYLDTQWHHQFKTHPRTVHALYADAQDTLNAAANFDIETDTPDSWYQIYTVGFSAVLRGSAVHNGTATGGLQIYANYRRYEGLENFKQQVISVGLRFEF